MSAHEYHLKSELDRVRHEMETLQSRYDYDKTVLTQAVNKGRNQMAAVRAENVSLLKTLRGESSGA
jgi:hypothetical protein